MPYTTSPSQEHEAAGSQTPRLVRLGRDLGMEDAGTTQTQGAAKRKTHQARRHQLDDGSQPDLASQCPLEIKSS